MLDTIKIKHSHHSLPCDNFRNTFRRIPNAKMPTWVLNDSRSSVPNITMLLAPNGIWHLSAEASVPKLLHGHNAKLPNQSEVESAICLMGKYVELHTEIPFDVQTATVSTVHFARDFHLTESGVWQTVKKLSKKTLPRMQKLFYNDTTLYFKSKSQSIRIYPKLQEVLSQKNPDPEAVKLSRGNLRIEHCLTSNYAINAIVRRYSLEGRRPSDILNSAVSEASISAILESLDFFSVYGEEKTALDRLLDNYPTRKAMKLLGFLNMVDEFGEDFYNDSTYGFNRRTYLRNVRNCRKAKVWKCA